MTLYLYKIGTAAPTLTLEKVRSYTAQEVVSDEAIYSPLAEGFELSKTADCTGTLRADYRAAHPSAESRMEDLETLVADILFGGGTV